MRPPPPDWPWLEEEVLPELEAMGVGVETGTEVRVGGTGRLQAIKNDTVARTLKTIIDFIGVRLYLC